MMTWGSMFFNSPNTGIMETIIKMHDYVSMFLISILLTVFISMYNLKYSTFFNLNFMEEEQLESVWTILPFLILLTIMLPSLLSLYMLDSSLMCGLSVTVVGHQWYWSYFYKNMSSSTFFDSYMTNPSNYLESRLLEVDNCLIIPVNIPSRFMVTSADVLHSWTIPSMGFKVDAVPGRLNQVSMTPKHTGVFYGQCSEICGANHSFMPICLESVYSSEFIKMVWIGNLS